MRILGVDPGLRGAAAILITGGDLDGPARVLDATDLPTKGEDAKRRIDAVELSRWICAHSPDCCFIERTQAFPQQGLSSTFIYGRACGATEAAVILARIPLHFIEPSVWKRTFGLRGDDKEMSRRAVLGVIPAAERFLLRKADHHRAEAILIAMFGSDLIAQGFEWHDRHPQESRETPAPQGASDPGGPALELPLVVGKR